MKVYTNGKGVAKDLIKIVNNTKESATPLITEEFLKDSNKLVPKQEGILINSSLYASDFEKGIAAWDTPYARRRYYEGSITGEKMWAEVNAKINKDKYEKMTKKVMEKEVKKL